MFRQYAAPMRIHVGKRYWNIPILTYISNRRSEKMWERATPVRLARRLPVKRKQLDDLVDEWYSSDTNMPLWQYLGMTYDEYERWVKTSELPPEFETYDW